MVSRTAQPVKKIFANGELSIFYCRSIVLVYVLLYTKWLLAIVIDLLNEIVNLAILIDLYKD